MDIFREGKSWDQERLCKHLTLSKATVSRYLRILYYEKKIYISDYTKHHTAGAWMRIFSLRLEDEEDTPRPLALTETMISLRYQARQKQKDLQNVLHGQLPPRTS